MRRDNKYEKILSVAARLMSSKGYTGASLQEIADKVGLHKSSLFHYIKNKEELLLRIFGETFQEGNRILKEISDDHSLEPEEKLKKAIDFHLTSVDENFDSISIFLDQIRSLPQKHQSMALKERKKYEKNFEKVIVEMKRKGYFEGLDKEIVTLGVLGMLNWVPMWFRRDGRLSIKEISTIFYKFIVEKL
jgi:TetR/AcrR family transcriptional regulator, cholesterol catabolism regulator